jgi:predicted nuclease with TOPRIM domain
VLNEYKQGVIETQNNIIRQKMDILFDYRNEKDIVDEYQELINDMETFNSEYTELLNKYNKLFNDEEKQATLTKMNVELFEFKQEFLQHLKEFNNTNNREHLHAAMNLHRNHIFVLKRRLHNIEYNVLEVYQENIKKDIFTFNKQEHTLSNMETSVDIDRVKHFVVKN